MTLRAFSAVLVAALAAACSSSSVSSPTTLRDSGARDSQAALDTGTSPPLEASVVDSGHPMDAAPPPAEAGEDSGEGMFDFACGGSTPCSKTQACCAAPSANTTFSCTASSACPMQNQILCDGPDECSGATPVCCAVQQVNGQGSYPNCVPSALGTSCTSVAACSTHIGQSCTDNSSVVLCHDASDCKDPNNPECCTFGTSSASLTFCIDSTTASLGGGTCH